MNRSVFLAFGAPALFAALLFSGCASSTAFDRSYSGASGSPAPAEPELFCSTDAANDRLELESEGYRLIGFSEFTAAEYSAGRLASQVRSLCLKNGASAAIYGGVFRESRTLSEQEPVRVLMGQRDPKEPPRYELAWRTVERSETLYDYFAYLYVPLSAEEIAGTKLGIESEDLSASRRIELRRNTGAYVRMVYKGTPAFLANIVVGDVITAVNGAPVLSSADFRASLGGLERGQSVQVTVYRDGAEQTMLMVSE